MTEQTERKWYKSYPSSIKKEIEIPSISVYTFLEDSAERFGDRIVIRQEELTITYQELKEKVDRLANAWKQDGLKKGDRLGLMVSNNPYYVVSYFAAMKLGLIVVQINPQYTARELLQIVNDAEPKCMVVEGFALPTLNQIKDMYFIDLIYSIELDAEEYPRVEELIKNYQPLEDSVSIMSKEDVAVIQYTGGTTGKVKGAMLTHYNIVANVYQSYAMYGEKMRFGEETILAATPLYHVYAMTSAMNLGVYIGATLLLIKRFETEKVLEIVKEHRPTFFPGVPRMYNAFVNFKNVENYGLDSLRFCSSGSAPLPIEVIRKFEELTGTVIGEGFGLSEASPSTHRNPPGGERKIGSIGVPFPNTDCKIMGEENEELSVGYIGELVIKGPQVMKGYWRNEEETYVTLQNDWLYTGDLAKMDEDGFFYIVGRKKEMIINGGFNVYPQEIENVLYDHPDIKECAVVGIPDPEKGEIIKAYLVAKDGVTIDIEDIKGFCYRNLTPYKVPKLFEVIDELPRNTVGKILKRVLKEQEKTN